jgi:chromate transporter
MIPWLRQSKNAANFLDGLNAASLALMGVVTVHLAKGTLVDPVAWGIGAAAMGLLLWKRKLNSAWLILGGGIVGILLGYR